MPKKAVKKKAVIKQSHAASKSAVMPSLSNVVGGMTLRNVRLVESHCKLSIADNKLPTELTANVEVRIGASVEDHKLLGDVIATLGPPEEGEHPSSISIMVDMQCVFDMPVAPDLASFSPMDRAAIETTVVTIVWPYVRMHVQSLTASMGVPPFTLPLFKFQVKGPPPKPELQKQ